MVKVFLTAAAAFGLLAGAAQAQDFDLSRIDTNGDGAVTLAEARAARAEIFHRLDADNNGVVTTAEREAAAQEIASHGGRLDRADANHDGVISESEFMNQPYRAFDFLDRNHDGVLSANETAGLRARMAQQ